MVTADGGDAGFLKFVVFLPPPPLRACLGTSAYTMFTQRLEWPVQWSVLFNLEPTGPARIIGQPWSPCFVDYALVVFRIGFGHEIPIFILPALRYLSGVVVLLYSTFLARGTVSTARGIQASRLRSYERKVYLGLCRVKPGLCPFSIALSGAFLTHMVSS